MLLAGLVGKVVAMTATKILAAPQKELQYPSIAGDSILNQRADEPPALSSVPARASCKPDGVIEALLIPVVVTSLGVLKSDLPGPLLYIDREADTAIFVSIKSPFHATRPKTTEIVMLFQERGADRFTVFNCTFLI